MSRGDSQLLCPFCGKPGAVLPGSSGHRAANGELPRIRECTNIPPHPFKTWERVEGVRLDQVLVQPLARRASGKADFLEFDRRRLADDLARYLLRTLSESELAAVVDAAVADIDSRIGKLATPLPDSARDGRHTHYITVEELRKSVLGVLKRTGRPPGTGGSRKHRVAHVLYALATEGAITHGKKGWRSAADVVRWMADQYPDLPRPPAKQARVDRRVDRWWPPSEVPVPTHPVHVVKRHPKHRDLPGAGPAAEEPCGDGPSLEDVPTEDFDLGKFERSIQNALAGRGDEGSKSKLVAQWVLWSLVGQHAVMSSQLAIGVTECLRRLDEIAYLRWATVAKELRVSWIYQEALGLLDHPPARLVFEPGGAPRMLPGALPGY